MTVVEVGYALAWDLEARAPWGPLAVEAARERDAAGLPYVAVHRVPGRAEPVEVRLVSWRDHYAGLWLYDELGRRTEELDWRLLDDPGLLLSRRTRAWRYTGPDMAEFDGHCPRSRVELFPDGRGVVSVEPKGDHGTRTDTRPEADARRWQPRPGFGDWPVVAALWQRVPGPVELRPVEPGPGEGAAAASDDLSGAPATCWRPPRPGRPGPIGSLFRPGTRLSDGYHPEMVVLEPRRCGTLRVPSGLLVVSGPDSFDDDPDIIVPVPPGDYVLEEARARVGYEWAGERVTRTDTTAVRLRIGGSPAVSWEMGLGPDHDPRLLGEGEAYGFGTDGATGCFADAGSWRTLRQLFEDHLVHGEPGAGEDIDDSIYLLRTRDEASGGELVAFATSGDGTYPVWVGRCAEGEVSEVVVLVESMPEVLPDDSAG